MEYDFTPYQVQIFLLFKDIALLVAGGVLLIFSIQWTVFGSDLLKYKDWSNAKRSLRKSLIACVAGIPALVFGFFSASDIVVDPGAVPKGAEMMALARIARILVVVACSMLGVFLVFWNIRKISRCNKMEDTEED